MFRCPLSTFFSATVVVVCTAVVKIFPMYTYKTSITPTILRTSRALHLLFFFFLPFFTFFFSRYVATYAKYGRTPLPGQSTRVCVWFVFLHIQPIGPQTIPSNVRGCQSGSWPRRGAKVNRSHNFTCPVDREQDWQPYPVDTYSCYMCDHTSW